eukprot:SAG11_NODE_10103_length_855_cov_0.604497_1_plen_178_part_10
MRASGADWPATRSVQHVGVSSSFFLDPNTELRQIESQFGNRAQQFKTEQPSSFERGRVYSCVRQPLEQVEDKSAQEQCAQFYHLTVSYDDSSEYIDVERAKLDGTQLYVAEEPESTDVATYTGDIENDLDAISLDQLAFAVPTSVRAEGTVYLDAVIRSMLNYGVQGAQIWMMMTNSA